MIVVYDLQDAHAWQAAHRHRSYWGKLYTDVHALDDHHVVLIFRHAPDQRWRPWESVRQSRILEQLQESEAA